MVAVWDVRSRKPMKMFTTDRSQAPPGGMARSGNRATGADSGWLYKDSWDWIMPGRRDTWGVKNVKFNLGIGGKEVMTFAEVHPHQSSGPGVQRFDARTWAMANITVTCC